jgi:threonine dehydrogenase-like Zn-dependent dehydrogenase
MKALVVAKPGNLDLCDIPAPVPGDYDALVRIRGCGVCGTTDREIIRGRQPYHDTYPAVLGHEAIGEILETGARVRSFRIGDLVTRPVAIWPGTIRDGLASGWGGFAEYGIVRDRLAMAADGDASLLEDYTAQRQQTVPPGMELPQAVLAISLAETASWFRHLPSVSGKNVCVSGTGIAGLGIVIWCMLGGARRTIILGRRDERLRLARELGATATINITDTSIPILQRLTALNAGAKADFFIDAVGKPDQLQLGLSLVRDGGVIAIYGVPEGQCYAALDFSTGPATVSILRPPAEEHLAYAWVCDLIRRGLIPAERLMTHSWRLDQYADAFASDGNVVKGWIKTG